MVPLAGAAAIELDQIVRAVLLDQTITPDEGVRRQHALLAEATR